MKRKLTFALLLSTAASVVFAATPVAGPITLELKPAFGLKTSLIISEKVNTTMSMMGQEMTMGSNTNSDYSLVARKDSAGLKSFTTVFNSTVKSMEQMGSKIDINTADPKADTTSEGTGSLVKFYKHLTGRPYTVYLDKTGNVVSTSGAKEIFTSASSSLDLTGPMAMMKSFVNESVLTADLKKVFNYAPGKAINVGDKWDRKDTIASNGVGMEFATKFNFDKLEGNVATLKANSIINFDGDMESMPGATAKIIGTAVYTIKVNIENGMLVSSIGDSDMEINMKAQGMEIPMKVSSNITVTTK